MASKTVRAAVITGVRQMEIREFPRPVIKDNDALLKVEMVGVCGSDPGMYTGKNKLVKYPVIPGHEIVGRIEEIGDYKAKISGCKVGDRVVVETRFGCGVCPACVSGQYGKCVRNLGYGFHLGANDPPYLWGAYSEYLYLPERAILHKISEDVPLETGALICAVIGNAVRWLNTIGGSSIGQDIAILGPGQQGLGAVCVAKESGAKNIFITGKSCDKKRLELAREYGANHIINVDEVDPIEYIRDVTHGKMCDLIMDVSGSAEAMATTPEMIGKLGTIVVPGLYGTDKRVPYDFDKLVYKEVTIKGAHTHNMDSVERAISLVESKKYAFEKMVTHKFPLKDAEKAIQIAGGEFPEEQQIKVVIEPNK